MKTLPFHLFFMLSLTACSPDGDTPVKAMSQASPGVQNNKFKDDLIHAIDISDRVVVTEHSYQFDSWDDNLNKSLIPVNIIYKKREITSGDKRHFLKIIKTLDGEIQHKHSLCAFEPHHSIDFYENGKLSSTMDICFTCNEIEWKGSKANPPLSLYSGLETLINDLGMESKKDWIAESKKHQN